MTAAMPDARNLALAWAWSVGAHGIMTLNDFKSVQGDLRMGVGSLPVRLGVDRAAQVACLIMAAACMAIDAGVAPAAWLGKRVKARSDAPPRAGRALTSASRRPTGCPARR
jgi:4-hydroxybenzoate polyprenyltransferase